MKSDTYSVRLPLILAPSEQPEALMAALSRNHPDIFQPPRTAIRCSEADLYLWLRETAAVHGFDEWRMAVRFDGLSEWIDLVFLKNP